MTKLDNLDLDIINLMRQNGRITVQDLAKKLDRRRATIHARISKLEENGIIKGYSVIPDFQKLGVGITVFILIAVHQSEYQKAKSMEQLSQKISELPYITEIHSVTGEYDYLLKARVSNLETLGSTVIFHLRKLFGASRTRTLAAFTTEKEELGLNSFDFLE